MIVRKVEKPKPLILVEEPFAFGGDLAKPKIHSRHELMVSQITIRSQETRRSHQNRGPSIRLLG
jgi:hypothetical protein